MARQEHTGICHICGEYKKLTYEHIPPEGLSVLPSPGQNMVAVRRKHVATKKKALDVEIGCLVLFVTQSFPRRDFSKAASA